MASKRKGKGLLSNSSADETQSKDCSPELSSIGEQVIVIEQFNDNGKVSIPSNLVNVEETSDMEGGANVSINTVHMPESRAEREQNNMASASCTPDIYQMMLQHQLMIQNLMYQQEHPGNIQEEFEDEQSDTDGLDVASSLEKLCQEAQPQLVVLRLRVRQMNKVKMLKKTRMS